MSFLYLLNEFVSSKSNFTPRFILIIRLNTEHNLYMNVVTCSALDLNENFRTVYPYKLPWLVLSHDIV